MRLIGAIEDITARKRHEEHLRQRSEELSQENVSLRQEVKRRLDPGHIVGRSAATRRTLELAEQVAATDSTVLLLGETGTGKERFASYIHDCSRRRNRLMIVVNCSAIPTPLLESELFGREKGAYTGALSRQVGRFELAQGSTLFLDEVGELPLEVQAKLLRVLENRTIERLGNPKPIPVDVRIVAATHRDLAAAVREGRFREDLFYRLNVFPLQIPPLRDRLEDVPSLVRTFVEELRRTMGKRIEEVDARSLEALTGYHWPGNVRELRNAVERAMITATGPTLSIDAPQAVGAEPATRSTHAGRAQIEQVLRETSWRIRGPHGAAARLGVKPTTLESRIRKLGLTRPGTSRSVS
jgi:transcriptional regulator with GAF, ATPase, and Fis domain